MAAEKRNQAAAFGNNTQAVVTAGGEGENTLPPLRDLFSCPIVTVKTGLEPDEKAFYVHQNALTSCSDFFKKTFLAENSKEGVADELKLPDVHTDVFALFLHWLYKGGLGKALTWKKRFDTILQADDLLCQLFVFGDRYLITALKVHVADKAVEYYKDISPSYGPIKYAFDNLPDYSPYARLLVDAHCKNWDLGTAAGFGSLPCLFVRMAFNKYAAIASSSRSAMKLKSSDYTINPVATAMDSKPSEKRQKTDH